MHLALQDKPIGTPAEKYYQVKTYCYEKISITSSVGMLVAILEIKRFYGGLE
jgi:hypothetical protein